MYYVHMYLTSFCVLVLAKVPKEKKLSYHLHEYTCAVVQFAIPLLSVIEASPTAAPPTLRLARKARSLPQKRSCLAFSHTHS